MGWERPLKRPAALPPFEKPNTEAHPIIAPTKQPTYRCTVLYCRGKYIVPFTSPKAKVIARVLRDRYLRSAQLPDITVGALSTFTVRQGVCVGGWQWVAAACADSGWFWRWPPG